MRLRSLLQSHKQHDGAAQSSVPGRTSSMKVTEKKAESIATAITKYFAGIASEKASKPVVYQYMDTWVISWEDGPEEWAYMLTGYPSQELLALHADAELPRPVAREPFEMLKTMEWEPYTSYAILAYSITKEMK